LTAPHQAEGRLATLAEQALAAMREHSEVTQDPGDRVLRRIVRFQERLFSSHRIKRLARTLNAEGGLLTVDSTLTPLERQGKATFTEFCATCHGGPTQAVNTGALQPADGRRWQPVRAAGERTGVHRRRMRNPSVSG
jgi:hypothetical protein